LSYVSFRPEYRLDVLREGMQRYRAMDPETGFVWLGFPGKEMAAAQEFVRTWPADEQATLLLLGNLTHDEFLSLLSRCFVYLRTPACDGVAASVLESGAVSTFAGTPAALLQGRTQSRRVVGHAYDFKRRRGELVEAAPAARRHSRAYQEQTCSVAGRLDLMRIEHRAGWLAGSHGVL
jgi:hypothetical protein